MLGLAACDRPASDPPGPAAQYRGLLGQAQTSGRRLLVVFGADWCPDCRTLKARMREEPLRSYLDEKYLVMNVDVCRYDCNMDFARRLGDPTAGGIPALVVVDPAGGTIVKATNGGEFAAARDMPVAAMLAFLQRYAGN